MPSFAPLADPLTLMEQCRVCVRQTLGAEGLACVHELPLPKPLQNYLLFIWASWAPRTFLSCQLPSIQPVSYPLISRCPRYPPWPLFSLLLCIPCLAFLCPTTYPTVAALHPRPPASSFISFSHLLNSLQTIRLHACLQEMCKYCAYNIHELSSISLRFPSSLSTSFPLFFAIRANWSNDVYEMNSFQNVHHLI